LFRKGNYPVETENDGDAPDDPANRQVSIFIPEKPIMPPP